MNDQNWLTKEQAIALYGGNASELARALKITPYAIYRWPDGKPIPEARYLRLRYELKPEAFDGRGQLID